MKKITLSVILSTICLTGFSQVQDVMVIEKNDNTELRLSIDEIRRVVFESSFVNPVGTLAEAVDLGLPSGVRWAKWNLGATAPSESGGYYGWADPSGQKTSTDINDYPGVNPPSEISGTQYDIVSQMWGGQWRIPTYDDINELYEKCEFYKSGSDVKVVGPNGNSIILPLAGSREGTEIYDSGNFAYYWSGTIHPDDNKCAWLFTIDMLNGKYGVAGGIRHFGLSIRPVWGTPKPVVTVSVTTGSASEITQTSARIGGTVSGVDSRVTVGIVYGTNQPLSALTDKKKTTTSMGSYAVDITDLTAGTVYYYSAYAEVDGEYYYGETKSFATENAPEASFSVTTKEATNVGETSATLNGYISSNNTTKSYTAGFFLATSGTPSSSNYTKKIESGNDKTGNYSSSVTGLTDNKTYYYRAYVLYDGNYYYGETKSFTTEAIPEVSITVTTKEATNVGETSATLNGSISASNTTKNYTAGFFLATSGTPSSSNYTKKVESGSNKTGNYSSYVSGLSANTKYYFRAYVLYDGDYYYGTTKNFTTQNATNGTLNGHDWVDLGLPSGIKWATCNIGAGSETDSGSKFAWGETTTRSTEYDWSHYKYANGNSMYSIGSEISGTQYDAALYQWGSTWRMPKKSDVQELINNCTITTTTKNGVNGYSIKGPNGKTIFMPQGEYWTSTLNTSYYAYYIYARYYSGVYVGSNLFFLGDNTTESIPVGVRAYGYYIRPVTN